MVNHTDSIAQLATLIKNHQHIVALTGAGISAAAGIPTLEQINRDSSIAANFSEEALEAEPVSFYAHFHQAFIDPIFNNGPTIAHNVLAQLEHRHLLDGVVTTNVDYLHEQAGSQQVAPIWSSLNINHCLDCGRIYPLSILQASVPHCPTCGGLISPDPLFRHIATLPAERAKADDCMASADLVLVIGSNGYYDNVGRTATVVDINPKPTMFDRQATLTIHQDANAVFTKLATNLHLPTTSITK
ncbi:SIR2 family NAD-dependent protein deacylase [Furfurilactobacillus siliginis]|uniref:protein acetyllysine N-acetyltransferase n=1 Tax=Furfurilactobacillus siliginis TaxID=348151 RepID=A0A0R2LGP7_9LACO|nr:Sir2 family NAD-dependent protein deacetylase [Furfurilactobacillus siliginis]KRN97204.1 hypothetical protein IV55_GL000127 [Furfurilactobacillus siliginis]GEK29323.1 hypothetical protein LSI01_16340 [Furfurilactobacillus siliginis]